METTRPPGFPGNPPARMPRAPTPARSPPPRPLRRGEMTFRPTHDVGPRTQCMSGLNYAAYGLPVNASRPGSPQAHASLGSGWRPTLAGWDWIPTGFRTRFRKITSRHLVPLDRAFPAHALLACFVLAVPASSAESQPWLEVRSPHFVVVSNADERDARRVALEFEQIRTIYQSALPTASADPRRPVVIVVVKDEDGLRALLPQYWEQRGPRPVGVFARNSSGGEALREE